MSNNLTRPLEFHRLARTFFPEREGARAPNAPFAELYRSVHSDRDKGRRPSDYRDRSPFLINN
jgi:hypothetical protein